MKKSKLALILSIISLLGTCVAYFYLPDTIPIHWNIKGEVDNTGPRHMALILGAIPLVIYFLMVILPKIDPKPENYRKHRIAYSIYYFYTILFLIIINWITILAALGIEVNIGLLVPSLVGILFIIMGNYMPQFRHNYFVGIKTPWALADEDNWKKTHFFGGYVFIFIGIMMIIMGIIQKPFMIYLGLVLTFCAVSTTYIYSYLIYKKSIKK